MLSPSVHSSLCMDSNSGAVFHLAMSSKTDSVVKVYDSVSLLSIADHEYRFLPPLPPHTCTENHTLQRFMFL